jgi:hypothetical protein
MRKEGRKANCLGQREWELLNDEMFTLEVSSQHITMVSHAHPAIALRPTVGASSESSMPFESGTFTRDHPRP